ncbi:DISARM system helicase DrmA [Micromonospora sp. WMMD1120]|uniref:DISARM system helicase DrmA n=1 Tax=Micromonospora sp. WMMD1120 TaxID=3016106 RepID=UPI0024168DBA|nr:DISARM system helicase DrmA [Micromonospora sp. WMMD1120]MDG4807227.1 DISARM system helicase DrmA [Micromonospora sp. WMMD1120]
MSGEGVLAVPDGQAIRDELQKLVLDDLLGPLGGLDEEFPTREDPLDRYILGRLAPNGVSVDPETQDELPEAGAPDLLEGDAEPSAPNVPSLTPSALGFTACVAGDVTELQVTAAWGRYERTASEREEHVGRRVWRRYRQGGSIVVQLTEGSLRTEPIDPTQPAVVVRGRARRLDGQWLVSLFLENRQPAPAKRDATPWIFQVELSATGAGERPVFVPRPEQISGGDAADQAERRRLAMAYRFHPEFAVGHGTAVRVKPSPADPRRADIVHTSTVPDYEVPFTDVPNPADDPDLPDLADVVLDMKRLAELAEDGPAEALSTALRPLVDGYRAWIARNEASAGDPERQLGGYRTQVRQALREAGVAADRIQAGIDLLGADPVARAAFGFANRAMYLQRVHSVVAANRRDNPETPLNHAVTAADKPDNHRWRPFQLAFVLLNLPALADPRHDERTDDRSKAIADLLWFPTGGGKTEAYLGLTAFTIAVRRRQPAYAGMDANAGLVVLMRYTLRLLTIQQFERAATLICAAETLRRADEATWGSEPFRIGLWVGGRVTPNYTDDAADWLAQQRRGRGMATRGQGSPHQLTTCPWCGTKIEAGRDISVEPVYRRTLVICPYVECPFSEIGGFVLPADRKGLPVLVVDEEIYRHPPALLIATVDKFAQLPWKGETAALFGRVSRRCERHGYLTEDLEQAEWERPTHRMSGGAPPARIVDCPRLRPPDLIIQDELHLISGPLGSLVGLYETAVDRLASWEPQPGHWSRPKVIASTATVRRANHQIEALFHRDTKVFPPAGLDAGDSYFARQRTTERHPGRRYVGICAHGIRIKSALIRVYVSVLGAAQKLHEKYGRNPVTDPYMTLVGYFNSLRDLGGMRRLVEDDVSTRLIRADERGLARRYDPLLKELTSRMPSDGIRPLLDQLAVRFSGTRAKGSPPLIDVLLATSMIAVGVDVPRLGVMVVANQPKSTAEYIQATSRVGRAAPGLVFTVFNWARPRDLSHYERFDYFHANVYRHVEALSVTPFAERAIDRGLTGVLVALVRDLERAYNANLRAQDFDRHSQLADHVVRFLKRRSAVAADNATRHRVEEQLEARLDLWARERGVPARRLAYDKPRRSDDVAGLLHRPEEGRWRQTTCPTSLRDVEPGIQLQLLINGVVEESPPPFLPRDTGTSTANSSTSAGTS